MAINEKGVPSKPKKQTKASAYRTQIISPRDPQSGLPTGKRQHSPFILVMPDSSQTPELTTSFLTGRPIDRVSVITYDPNGVATGAVGLVNVQVVSMTETRRSFVIPHILETRGRLSGVSSNPLYEDAIISGEDCVYELTYQKIEWLDASGRVTHEDTWDAQR
jgi:type VI secretion system secreted protein Hcp